MKLTREELAEIQKQFEVNRGCPDSVILHKSVEEGKARLLGFAETMLPLRDALLTMLAAEVVMRNATTPAGGAAYSRASRAFWKLGRKLAETEAEVNS